MSAVMLAALLTAAAAPQPPVSIRDLIEMTDLSGPSISPDGRLVAFREETGSIARNDYDLGWYVVPIDGSAPPRRIGDAGEGFHPDGSLLTAPVAWAGGSTAIVFRAVIDGQAQLWRAAADGNDTEQLTHDLGNVIDFHVASDGRGVTYTTGAPREETARAEQREYDDGVLIDKHVDPARNLYRDARIDGRWASVRLTGFWFAHSGLLSDRRPAFHTLDLATRTERLATAAEASSIHPPAVAFDMMDGWQVLARAESGDARGSAWSLSLDGKYKLAVTRAGGTPTLAGATVCGQPECQGGSVNSISWQQTAERVLFARANAGQDTLYLWDVESGKVRKLRPGDGLLSGSRVGDQGCAAGDRAIVCVAASADVPPHLVAIDPETGAARTLADPDRALERSGQPTFQALHWTGRAGQSFSGELIVPVVRAGPVPLFVTYYTCGGYLRGGAGDEFPLRQFAEHGIAALCINRAPGMPGVHDQIRDYRTALSGIKTIVGELADQRVIDRRRVGMAGMSFGGEVTLWAAIHSTLFSALALSTSNSTPTFFWLSAMPGRDAPEINRKAFGLGWPDLDPKSWKRVSAAANADRIRAPVLMQEPEQEYRDNVELAARLGRDHTPVEMWAFPEETHVKYQPRHRLAAANRYIDWFRFWLQGYIDPDPTKADQYRRWKQFDLKPGWRDKTAGQ